MASYYTPYLTQAGAAIGRGLESKGLQEQKMAQNQMAADAYMGDPRAMQDLMQVNPQLGMKMQEQVRKRKETTEQQALEKRAQFKEDYDDLMANIAKFDSFEEADGYAEPRIDELKQRYPELMAQVGEDEVFDEEDYQLAKTLNPVKEKKGGGFKSADANAIYKRAAELFGGVFDQQGNLISLDPKTQPKVLEIAKRGERLYMDALKAGTPLTHSEAASQAAKEMGEGFQEPKTEIRVDPKTGKRYEVDLVSKKVIREVK